MNTNGPIPQDFCSNGHEMVEDNIIQRYAKDGTKNGRKCRLCTKLEAQRKKRFLHEKYRLNTKYGIESYEEVQKILDSQGGKCAICGTSDCVWGKGFENVWHIDHKHDGTINHRGILCSRCNLLIGKFNDDANLLEKAALYLRKFD